MTDKFIRKYMRFAYLVGSDQNPCLSRGIGSVIVDPVRNKIVSTGYNGPAKGVPHMDSRESLEEFIFPQLTIGDIKYINENKVDLTNWSPIETSDDFADIFVGCKICPRQLVGAKSGERLDLCSCLSYESKVLLENGNYAKIGDLVRNKYNGNVKSLNVLINKVENKQVIGWYELDRKNKQFYQIITKIGRSGKHGLLGPKYTGDHEVLTNKGFYPVGSLVEGDKLILPEEILDSNQLQLILGSLMGDASISLTSGSARFYVSHSTKQSDYIEYKKNILGNFTKQYIEYKRNVITPNGRLYENHIMKKLVSISKLEFLKIRQMTYNDRGIKLLSYEWLDQINWLGFCFWFLDDGSKTSEKCGYIQINKFNNDAQILLDWMLQKFGIVGKHDNKNKRILFNTENFEIICQNIYKYVPQNMRYKLSPKYQNNYLIELPIATSRLFYDEVVQVIDFDYKKSKSRTKIYCIDVECNHNFLTINSVAHNCVHSEANAVINAACDCTGFYLFAYCSIPCINCCKEIINAGIKRVYCLQTDLETANNTYGSWRSLWKFGKAGVEVIQLKEDWIHAN